MIRIASVALLVIVVALVIYGWPAAIRVGLAELDAKHEVGTTWMNGSIRKTSFDDGVDCYENRSAGYGSLSCVRRAP